jgi:glycosyltransferase involved in cell wall biosynthesis
VCEQTYRPIEHIIVSDGPDPELRAVEFPDHVRYCELPEHTRANGRWGTAARLAGISLARGEYITYLDDDDKYRPKHIEVLAKMLDDNPDIGFSYSLGNWVAPGDPTLIVDQFGKNHGQPCLGQIGTSTFMHRRELLNLATWRDDGRQFTIDWDLIERWLAAGVLWMKTFDMDASADFIRLPTSSLPEWGFR